MAGRDFSDELFGPAPAAKPKQGGRDLSADLFDAPSDPAAESQAYIKAGDDRLKAEARGKGVQAGKDMAMFLPNVAFGTVRGAGSIGSTILAPKDMLSDYMDGKGLSLESNRARRAGIDGGLAQLGADPSSAGYKVGKLGGEIAGTAGVGGIVANGARALGAPAALTNAIATGGMRAGATSKLANVGARVVGGAITGAASASMVNPEEMGAGAAIGGMLPLGMMGVGGGARYLGNAAKAVVQPFTKAGQEKIAGRIINEFGQGGPMAVDARELVKGSLPTLAEATGNAGIAGAQRAIRDVRPNAFVGRERANAAARVSSFDELAGDAGKLDFFRADRATTGKQLYDKALSVAPPPPTPAVQAEIGELLKRPSISAASKKAQQWALERGEAPGAAGSMRGLHDTKTALDDMINEAVMSGNGGHAKALEATKAKLLNVMEEFSPAYRDARQTYAAMSKPVNEMEALQGLKLTDARGNITLSKVQNALGNLEMRRGGPGTDAAKAIDAEKMAALRAIRDDLLRESNLAAGKSAGSNTFQNIATDGILSAALPGKLGAMAKGKVGGAFGQVGQVLYSKPNEAIRNNLADFMLDPAAAQRAMTAANAPTIQTGTLLDKLLKDERARQAMYRTVPLLGRD